MVVVGIRRRAFLPVVRIGLEIFAPVELFEIVQFLEFERGVTRFGLDAGRGFFLARTGFPVVIGIRAGGRRLGRQRFTVGLGGGFGIGHLGFGSGFGGTLIERLEHRILFEFRLHDRFEFRERKLQNFDRLLELRRHHQLLAKPQILSEFYFQRHRRIVC